MFSLGHFLTLQTFGESHGPAIGGVISNFPAGIRIDLDQLRNEMERRRPGQSRLTTQRKEADEVEILSGMEDGITTGAPIGFIIRNQDQRSKDYSANHSLYRPSHADFTYDAKFGLRSVAGGGRSSARETANWVAAGALAKQILPREIKIHAYVSSVGDLFCEKPYQVLDFTLIEESAVRCPDPETARQMEKKILEIKKAGNTIGGTVTCVIRNVPAGLGEPVFAKLHAELGHAMLSINAAKGFEFGSGFCGSRMTGAEHNDQLKPDFSTRTNLSGGIQGGISNGMDIYFRVAFKPVATLMMAQQTVDRAGKEGLLQNKGRHDPCVVPRAVPIVENIAAFMLADFYLIQKIRKSI